jgi:hypothetical protein
MGLTLFQQLITVACLAFSSGLLMGVAIFRGELGERRFQRSGVSASGSAEGAAAPKRPRRRPPNLAELRKSLLAAVKDIDPALLWVLIALAILLSFSGVITRVLE